MAALSAIRRWEPYTYFGKDEVFQFKGVAYKVLEGFLTSKDFEPEDSRYTVTDLSNYVIDLEINDDNELVATFADNTTKTVGAVTGGGGGSNYYGVIERLVVTAPNVLSTPNQEIDVTKPVKLSINGLAYYSVSVPAPFTVAADSLTWSAANAGFPLDTADSVVIEYMREH
jgi:hypothetical protein